MGGDTDPELLRIGLVDASAAVVVQVRGEVDDLTAAELGAALADAADLATERAVVVDLSGVTFIGSAGFAVLASAPARFGARVHVATGDNRRVVRPLAALGLPRMMPVHGSVDEAFAALLRDG